MNAPDVCPDLTTYSDQSLDKAEELIWKLLDDNLSEDGVVELIAIFKENPSVCEVYIDCVQLHVALAEHHGKLPQLAFPDWLNAPLSSWTRWKAQSY